MLQKKEKYNMISLLLWWECSLESPYEMCAVTMPPATSNERNWEEGETASSHRKDHVGLKTEATWATVGHQSDCSRKRKYREDMLQR